MASSVTSLSSQLSSQQTGRAARRSKRQVLQVRAAVSPAEVARLTADEFRVHCRLLDLPFDAGDLRVGRIALLRFLFPGAPPLRPRRRL